MEKHSPLLVVKRVWIYMEVGSDQGAPFGNLSGVVIFHAPGELVRLYKFFSLETHLPKMF